MLDIVPTKLDIDITQTTQIIKLLKKQFEDPGSNKSFFI